MPPIANGESLTNTEDNLIANSTPPIATKGNEVLIAGQNLARGSVLGRITATNKLTLADDAAIDGSDTPVGILVHDIDATAADKTCQIYVAGCFHNDELTWDASFTALEKMQHFDGSPIVLR